MLLGYKLLFDPLDLGLLLGPPQQGLHPELEVQEGGVSEGGQQPRHLYSVQESVQESVQYSLATSRAPSIGLMGTSVTPTPRLPSSTGPNSGQFGTKVATRSPGRSPVAAMSLRRILRTLI